MNPYEAFVIYNNIKLHFTSSYDYVRFNGKSPSTSIEIYKKVKSKYHYEKFSKKYPDSFRNYCIASFLNFTPKWIKDIDTDESLWYYSTLERNISNLGLTLRNDLIKNEGKTFKEVINNYDCLKEFSNETLVILNHIVPICKKYELSKIEKYSKFFRFDDLDEYKKIIKEIRKLS